MNFFKRNILWLLALVVVAFIFAAYLFLFSPPANFPSGSIVIIPQGTSAPLVAKELFDAHVIKYPTLLELALRISRGSNNIQAGAYRFQKPQNLFIIMYRVVAGAYDIPPSRITFPEGTTVREAATQIAGIFPSISAIDFITVGKSYEGYLFPDTYLFSPTSDAESIMKLMRANFNTKISILSGEITASGHSLSDIVIMASLIEKEARTSANRRIVAGVLWDRLKLGMPLQVDAVFGYIFNRDTYSPSLADLKTNSLYNTYLHTGLPPGPIDNPGLDSLEAVLNPTKTNYLYYLTDKNGVMHYATTYAEHQVNQNKYLR
jgi:UPF0755 protein